MAMSKPQLYSALEKIIECSLCLDRCTKPRSLPCLHTFCESCIQQLIDKSGQPGKFSCPQCRTDVQVPKVGASGFPGAFLCNTLRECVDSFTELGLHEKPLCKICSNDGKETFAIKLCVDCMKTFCNECLKPHNQIVSNHTMLDCENISPSDLDAILKSKLDNCPKHPDKKIELYCDNCKELVCIMCAVLEHAAHSKQELGKIAKDHKENLENLSRRLEEGVQHYETCFAKIAECEEKCKLEAGEKNQMLEEHGQAAMRMIQSFIEQGKAKLKKGETEYLESLKSLNETCQRENSRLINGVSHTHDLLKHGNDTTLIKSSVEESPKFEALLQELAPKHNIPQMQIDIQFADVQKLSFESLVGNVECKTDFGSQGGEAAGILKPMLSTRGRVEKLKARKVGEFGVPFNPRGVACTPEGKIVVCDNYSHSVSIYEPDGEELIMVNTLIDAEVSDVAVTFSNILVADARKNSVIMYDYDGSFKRYKRIKSNNELAGLATVGNELFVTGENKVWLFHTSTDTLTNIRSFVDIDTPAFIAASESHVAVSCQTSLQIFDHEGNFQSIYRGERTQVNNQANITLLGVVFDNQDRIIVSSFDRHAVHFLSLDGCLIGEIDLSEDGLYNPLGVTINSQCQLVIACGQPKAIATYEYIFE